MKIFDTGAPLYTEKQIEEAEKEIKMTVVQLQPPYLGLGFDDSVFVKPSSCLASKAIRFLLVLYFVIQFIVRFRRKYEESKKDWNLRKNIV